MSRLSLLVGAALFGMGACSSNKSTTSSNVSAAGTSAAPSGSGAVSAVAGTGTTGSAGMLATGSGGAGVSVAAGTSATGGAGARAAASGTSGGSAAGSGGAAGATAAGSGGGGAPAGDCTRELLASSTDSFYMALAAHNTAMLQLADGVKFTENGMKLEPGKGLWEKAGMLKYKHSALDVETCTSVSESVVPDGSMDIPVGVRLKLASQKISEIELIVVRPGDYTVFGSPFASNTSAIAASRDVVKWEEVVPAAQRNTRAEITMWLERYFKTFPRGGCSFADNCQRLENGGGSFQCSAALSCDMTASLTGTAALKPRLLIADPETGIGVGFTLFMGHTDFHMIKMYGGKIYAVHAILSAASSSGWD